MADSVAREGDTLVAKGVKTLLDQDGARMEGALDEMRFRDLGDGTVEITASDIYSVTMTMPPTDGKSNSLNLAITQPGLRAVAAGNASETNYVYEVPMATISMQALENGVALADINAKLTQTTGKYLVTTADGKSTMDSSADVQTVAFTIAGKEGENVFDMTGTLAGLQLAGGGTFLGIAAMEDMAQALKDGVALKSAISYGAGSFDINATDSGKRTHIAATNESGHFNFGLDGQAMRYAAGGTGVELTLSGDDIPFPEIKISYGEAAFDLLMPVQKADMPADFAFLTKIVDLAISEDIWGMFDPAGQLSHEPASVVVDVKGKATVTTDIFDEKAMEAIGEAPPGELHALTISNLLAKFSGAELTGSGDFTFDNTDLATFGGMPAPTGKIDLMLTGGNALLDKLIAMGLVSQDDAMGARMMIAMFAKPGAAPDSLTSTLEFKDKGFFANGQRLQ